MKTRNRHEAKHNTGAFAIKRNGMLQQIANTAQTNSSGLSRKRLVAAAPAPA